MTAYHEGGHTLCALLVPGADPVNRVTIIPHGQTLGVTYQRPDDDQQTYSEEYLQARIVGAMGGRAAEEVVYGGRTTGAENDIQQASTLARQMVTRWGMSDELGPMTLAPRDDLQAGFSSANPYSEAIRQSIDAEVQRILQVSYAAAVRLLQQNRPQLDALAEALLEYETLDEQDILRVTGMPRSPRLDNRPISIQTAASRCPA
jgi:cell division protease FtsH